MEKEVAKECVYKTSRELKVVVPAQDLVSTLLDDIIAERVADMVTEEHDGNGIVVPGSVKIISRTPLYQDLTRFDGAYACHVRYVADCYDAPKGMITTATVRVTLPNGVLCETEMPELPFPAFRVFLPYEVHDDETRNRMRVLIRDQVVRFRSIQRYGGLGDHTIDVLGMFIESVGDPPVAPAPQKPAQPGGDLRVEDFHAPKGPDSDDPGVIQQHGPPPDGNAGDAADDGAAADDASFEKESVYDLWSQYNAALAKSLKRDAGLLSRGIIRKMRALEAQHMWYDPTHRRYTAFLPGLDTPAEHPHYLYRPLPDDNLGSVRGSLMHEPYKYTPVGEYDMVITNPKTIANESTVTVLQRGLPRRVYGMIPMNVTVMSFIPSPGIAFQPADFVDVGAINQESPRTKKYPTRITVRRMDPGQSVGKQVYDEVQQATHRGDVPDLIVLDARRPFETAGGATESKSPETDEPDVLLDPFIPTYPLVVDAEILVCTPLQLIQCGDGYSSMKSPMETLRAVLNDAAATIGAHIQRPPGPAGSVTPRPASSPSSSTHLTQVFPDTTIHVPTIEHGWMSLDTHAALVGTIRAIRPRIICELGSWYGLSTRTMLGESRDTTIYAFDKFKAAPMIDYKKNRIGVEDNFFFNHPRFETFAANVSTALTGLGLPAAMASAAGSMATSSNKVVMVRGDASKIIQVSRKHRFVPEMVFIDYEKNTERLTRLITSLRKAFPRAFIVGDDHVFESVKRAIRTLPKDKTIVLGESYVILPGDATPAIREELEASIATAREEFGDSEQQAVVKGHIGTGRVEDVLRTYSPGESVTTTLPHTQAQMSLHESLRYAKNKYPREINEDIVQKILDDSKSWNSGCVNFCALTPWDYIAHKLSFFKGEDC